MLDSKIKTIIDSARDILVGKVPNPQSQIDLITIAMIYKFMDDMDNSIVKAGGSPSFFKDAPEKKDEKKRPLTEEDNDRLGNLMSKYAWHKLLDTSLGNEDRLQLYSKALDRLQISKNIPQLFRQIFKGAFLPFRDGATLSLFLKEINKLSYDNSENLGNGFEYLLKIMGSQGDAGQFRTPRHIIDFIVDVIDPKKDNTILDPACGTAGFLISAFKHILKHNSEAFNPKTEIKSYASSIEEEDLPDYNGDKLTPKERTELTQNIKGYDISPDMQKLALVNLYLHGFRNPDIAEYDTLTQETKWKDTFDVILANPPFMTPKGGIKPHKKFSIQANRSEVLFVDYIVEHLNLKGKAGIIVPEGIIFQSQTAYKKLRKLIQENYLYAVVSLPSGIFQPYSGVKTSILFIDRELAKKADSILFVDVKNDGYGLGAQRKSIKDNDLQQAYDVLKEYQTLLKSNSKNTAEKLSKYSIANLVPKSQIAKDGDYYLSVSRYLETNDYSNCKWDMVRLGNICTTTSGGTPLKENKEFYTPEEIPWICSGEVRSGEITSANKYISKIGLEKSSAKMVPANSVLIAMYGATAGQVGILKFEASTNQAICSILPNENFNPKFLYYILSSKTDSLIKMSVGGAQPNISQAIIKNIEIPLPPLEAQEEMVKELDAYQAVIDGAKKAIENWKPTLPRPINWKKVKIGDICKDFKNGVNFSKEQVGTGTKFVNIKDVFNDYGYINTDALERVDIDKKSIVSNKVNDDDLIFVRSSVKYEGVGYPSLVKTSDEDVVFCGFLIKCSPDKTKVYPRFLLHLLKTNHYRNKVISASNRANITNISQENLKTIEVMLPTLAEQKQIVAKIEIEEQAIEHCKKLIELHEQKISDKIKSIWGECL